MKSSPDVELNIHTCLIEPDKTNVGRQWGKIFKIKWC